MCLKRLFYTIMGCVFGCLRVKEEKKLRSKPSLSVSHLKNQEPVVANTRQDSIGSSDLLDALANCEEKKRRRRSSKRNSILDASPEAAKLEGSLRNPIAEPVTPNSGPSPATNEHIKELKEEVKYLKSWGTILKTPIEIRQFPDSVTNGEDAKANAPERHSWFPTSSVNEIQYDGPPEQAPTPPASLHGELCQIPTPNLMRVQSKRQRSGRFSFESRQDAEEGVLNEIMIHTESKAKELDSLVDTPSAAFEGEDHQGAAKLILGTGIVPPQNLASRYDQCPSIDEDEDYLSDPGSASSHNDAVQVENFGFDRMDSNRMDSAATSMEQETPPLVKSKYSPQVTPLWLSDTMRTPYTENLESTALNHARFRNQHAYPVLNPVENISQWEELKQRSHKKHKSWSELSTDTENHTPTVLGLSGSTRVSVDSNSFIQRLNESYSFPRGDSASKENFADLEQFKLYQEFSQQTDYSVSSPHMTVGTPKSTINQVTADKQTSPSPVGLQVNSSLTSWLQAPVVENEKSQFCLKDLQLVGSQLETSLCSWLEPSSAMDHKVEQITRIEVDEQLVDTHVEKRELAEIDTEEKIAEIDVERVHAPPAIDEVVEHDGNVVTEYVQSQNQIENSESKSQASSAQHFANSVSPSSDMRTPSIINSQEEKPILSSLSSAQLNSLSSGSKSTGDYDRPIIGWAATYWNDQKENVKSKSKWWDGKGIPNSTNKYKEDQKVNWHSTPFEERLEKALSNDVQCGKAVCGKPLKYDEQDEQDVSDTAAS